MYIHTSSIIESVDFISTDELDALLMQYNTNTGLSRDRYTITHFIHHHRVYGNRMSVEHHYIAQFYIRTARSKKS